jgi:hypothetical protein
VAVAAGVYTAKPGPRGGPINFKKGDIGFSRFASKHGGQLIAASLKKRAAFSPSLSSNQPSNNYSMTLDNSMNGNSPPNADIDV